LNGRQNKKTKDMRGRADQRGHFAERIACWWPRLAGYQIVARRWRAVVGEIDLIAKRRRLSVVVEVKYRFDSQNIAAPTPLLCQKVRSPLLYSSSDIQLFLITNAGLICLLLIMVKSCLWVAPTILKMHGNKRYITLTDESQNATLTFRMSDRS
jgi:hypothetical protein